MAAKKKSDAPASEKCPSCGACKECGHGGVKFVPYPVPYWPQPVAPYRPPWQPTYPQPTWIGTPVTTCGSGNASSKFTFTSNTAGDYVA